MPRNLSVNLGLKGLKDLRKELVKYQKDMDKVGSKIVTTLVNMGEAELNRNISSIQDNDGNAIGFVETSKLGGVGKISHVGDQVVFLEFGTGIPGANLKHPQSGSIGYEYNAKRSARAHRTRSSDGAEGWWYRNLETGKSTFTTGIRGEWQVYNTAMYLRRVSSTVINDVLGGKI